MKLRGSREGRLVTSVHFLTKMISPSDVKTHELFVRTSEAIPPYRKATKGTAHKIIELFTIGNISSPDIETIFWSCWKKIITRRFLFEEYVLPSDREVQSDPLESPLGIVNVDFTKTLNNLPFPLEIIACITLYILYIFSLPVVVYRCYSFCA